MFERLNPYLLRAQKETKYFINNPEEHKGRWSEAYHNKNEIFVDLGCGSGTYAIEMAKKNPEYNFLAIDYAIKYLYKGILKAKQCSLSNVKFLFYDIGKTDNIFEANELDGVSLLFSDPYKKSKQLKHRVVNINFLQTISEVLKTNRYLTVKTDDKNYFQEILSVLEKSSFFKIVARNDDFLKSNLALRDIKTPYEKKFAHKKIAFLLLKNITF